MTKENQPTSSKTAADAIACIKQADELLQEAVNENEQLSSKLASVTQSDEQFSSSVKEHIEKLASTADPASGKPLLTETQKQAWLDYMESPESTKVAAAHLISELIGQISKNGGSDQEKTAAETGEVADMPGRKTASEKREPIHPTARY